MYSDKINKFQNSLPHSMALVLVCAIFLCSGCHSTRNQTVGGRMVGAVVVDTTPPNGPLDYRRGWHDGCESGLAEVNELVKFPYKKYVRKVDSVLVYQAVYWNAWNSAHKYCSYSVLAEKEYAK